MAEEAVIAAVDGAASRCEEVSGVGMAVVAEVGSEAMLTASGKLLFAGCPTCMATLCETFQCLQQY